MKTGAVRAHGASNERKTTEPNAFLIPKKYTRDFLAQKKLRNLFQLDDFSLQINWILLWLDEPILRLI